MKYKHAAVAGTFDHFHAGHRFLLKEVFENSAKVSVGLTSEAMVKDKLLAKTIEPFKVRKEQLELYLEEQSWAEKAKIFTLHDIYGTAIEDKTLDTIFTTTETEKNAQKINELREEKGLKPLEIVTLPLKEGNDDEVISSTRIRLGLIDREGRSYLKPFTEKELFTTSVLVRDELKSPIGELISGTEKDLSEAATIVHKMLEKDDPILVITVGDIVTQTMQAQKREPDISFVDHRSRREVLIDVVHKATEKHGPYQNDAGTIRSNIVRIYTGLVQETIHLDDHNQIIIEGEEDLLGLPAIILAPLGAVVLYGQPDAGIVYVSITEEIKLFCYEMLQRFV